MLLDLGVKKERLVRNTAYLKCIRMLQADRVDMVGMSWETFSLFAAEGGIDTNHFEKVFTLASSDLYYAFYKGTPESIVGKFQDAFADLKAEGISDALIRKYKEQKN